MEVNMWTAVLAPLVVLMLYYLLSKKRKEESRVRLIVPVLSLKLMFNEYRLVATCNTSIDFLVLWYLTSHVLLQ